MSLSAQEWGALLPVAIPAAAGSLIPLAVLDRDQATVKWIRAGAFAIALMGLLGSYLYVGRLWQTGLQPTFGHLRMDLLAQFAALFILVTASITVLQLWDHLHHEGWVKGESLALMMFSVTGMLTFTATTNLAMLFLGLELLSIPLYALTAQLRFRATALEGGMKYFLTGALASAGFLMGISLLYAVTGSLELPRVAQALRTSGPDPLAFLGLAFLLMGFLFKVSAVPFHQWTPDVYEAAPHPIAGFMSVATKGVGFIALIRVLPWALGQGTAAAPKVQTALALAAAATMILGNLVALHQTSVKRLLAYSSISHAGYLLLGLVAGTPEALTGMLFYLIAYLAMNLGAFGLLTALGLPGDGTDIDRLRGQGWKRPTLGFTAALCLFSLAGIPPTAGFYGKYFIFKELVLTGHVGLAILGVVASLVSVGYYLRVLKALFLDKASETSERDAREHPEGSSTLTGATLLVCALITLMGGLFQGPIVERFAGRAITDTLNVLP